MPTPADVSGYLDLRLVEADAQTLVDRALLDARSKLPAWQPREGNTETVLLEAMALQVAEAVYAINQAPDSTVEVLLKLFGLTRDAGAPPVGSVRLHVATTGGTTLPAGVRLRLTGAPGSLPLELETTTDVVIPAGATSGVAQLRGLEHTDEHNGAAAGTGLTVVEAVTYLDRAVLETALAGGRPPEDGPGFLERGAARLQRITSALVLPEHFTARAAEDSRVGRALAVDRYNPAATTGGPGDHPGYVTVGVLGADGGPLTPTQRVELETALEADALASLIVRVVDATVTAVDVTATVVAEPLADPATVRAAAETALRQYLNPSAWTFGGTVYRNELVALLDRVTGVARVVDLATPANLLDRDTSNLEVGLGTWHGVTNATTARSGDVGGRAGGTSAAKITLAAAGRAVAATGRGTNGVPVPAGRTIAGAADVFAWEAARSGRAFLEFYDRAGAALGTVVPTALTALTAGGWTRLAVSGASPAGTAYASLHVELGSGGATESIYAAAAAIAEGPAAPFTRGGSAPDLTLTGVAPLATAGTLTVTVTR